MEYDEPNDSELSCMCHANAGIAENAHIAASAGATMLRALTVFSIIRNKDASRSRARDYVRIWILAMLREVRSAPF
jgi:hypothetical protein